MKENEEFPDAFPTFLVNKEIPTECHHCGKPFKENEQLVKWCFCKFPELNNEWSTHLFHVKCWVETDKG